MALDIHIVGENFANWKKETSFFFAGVDPREWESLYFKDLGIKDYCEFIEVSATPESYEKYLSGQYAKLQEKFPMISRIKDYYDDAIFSKEEVRELMQEIKLLEGIVKYELSRSFLRQLSSACETAQNNDAGIVLIAD